MVGALIIVRHFGKAIDRIGDRLETRRRHRHGAQAEGAAHFIGVEQRSEAGQRAIVQQPPDAGDDVILGNTEIAGDGTKRTRLDGNPVLQAFQQPAIEAVKRFHHATVLSRRDSFAPVCLKQRVLNSTA